MRGDAVTAVEAIGELFAGPGARDYLGEPVTIGEHMRQAGALAEAAGATAPLVAAALLHDIGHLLGEQANGPPRGSSPPVRTEQARRGGRGVAEPVVRRDSDRAGAAARSGETVPVRRRRGLLRTAIGRIGAHAVAAGRPDAAAEAAAFESLPHARDAVAVRRWDDQAKDPAVSPPRLAHFAPYLRRWPGPERDSALTAVELCTLNATALPR